MNLTVRVLVTVHSEISEKNTKRADEADPNADVDDQFEIGTRSSKRRGSMTLPALPAAHPTSDFRVAATGRCGRRSCLQAHLSSAALGWPSLRHQAAARAGGRRSV